MAIDHIRYDLLTQDALRSVVRTVLIDVAKNGLPGEHHIFISFHTHAEGVRISERLLAQYPDEMTVVLQHQFWDLTVSDDAFEVGLSFGGIPERLTIPFAAIKAFVDPAVQFGVQFENIEEAPEKADTSDQTAPPPARKPGGAPRSRAPAERKGKRPAPIASVPVPANPPTDNAERLAEKPTSAEVVRLDRFRKK